eukprot:2132763-Amphidinium_carterae.1
MTCCDRHTINVIAGSCELQEMELAKSRYGFGCSWMTSAGRTVDIDLQCVIVDDKGEPFAVARH